MLAWTYAANIADYFETRDWHTLKIGERVVYLFSTADFEHGAQQMPDGNFLPDFDDEMCRVGVPRNWLLPVTELGQVHGIDEGSLERFIARAREEGTDIESLYGTVKYPKDTDLTVELYKDGWSLDLKFGITKYSKRKLETRATPTTWV